MSMAAILEQLRTRIGLDAGAIGPTLVPNVVAARMRALGIDDLTSYTALLAESADEFGALVDDIIVPETWFFRGGEKLFAYLVQLIRATIAARPPDRPFRVLSAPCSSGEEPYSLAIALTEAQIPAGRWSIDGVDLSRRVLESARRGRYRDLALRETAPALRERYFRQVEGSWEIVTEVRTAVRFTQANLVESFVLADAGTFDLIFCRNLLIYLDPPARVRVLTALARLLAPQGLLCTGHAEPLSLLDRQFRPTGPAGFFLYQRSEIPAVPWPALPMAATGLSALSGEPLAIRSTPQKVHKADTRVPIGRTQPAEVVVDARALADAGQLEDALALCHKQLAARASADLYCLMGIIHQARHERAEAAQAFRKALYLDPSHAETLTQFLLLSEENGDSAGAARLRGRLRRATAGGES